VIVLVRAVLEAQKLAVLPHAVSEVLLRMAQAVVGSKLSSLSPVLVMFAGEQQSPAAAPGLAAEQRHGVALSTVESIRL